MNDELGRSETSPTSGPCGPNPEKPSAVVEERELSQPTSYGAGSEEPLGQYGDSAEGLGPRCSCGHYRSEHSTPGEPTIFGGRGCHGAYATLAADADDRESVEVPCGCEFYDQVDASYHLVRT